MFDGMKKRLERTPHNNHGMPKSVAGSLRSDESLRPNTRPFRDQARDIAGHLARSTILYVSAVWSTAFHGLHYPISFAIFIWMLATVTKQLSPGFRSLLAPVFAPLCLIPRVSSSSICLWNDNTNAKDPESRRIDYRALTDVQSRSFEQLLDDTAGGSSLALEIKKAEIATSDLITLVRFSHLTSKEMLADCLSDFVDEAKRTGKGLQKLGAKVFGAIDSTLAVNDYALRTITASVKNDGYLPILSHIFWPFDTSSKRVVARTFREVTEVLSASMARILVQAEVQLNNLDELEQKLNTIHDILTREGAIINAAQSDLLAELWTWLGGNRHALRSNEMHLILLKNLGDYRRRALAHVVAALQTLQGISEEVEELRERVAAPTLLGEQIPAEVHIKSIWAGLERMKDMRVEATERENEAVRKVLSTE